MQYGEVACNRRVQAGLHLARCLRENKGWVF